MANDKNESITMENGKKDTEIKFRCPIAKKAEFKECADEVGLTMSDFIRTLIFGKEKLVILSKGAEIAKALFLIHTDLEYFRSNGGIPDESVRAITEALNDVSSQLNAVSEKLTDIHNDNEEAEADE
ncbi:hypothetical protein [Ruminococcus sp.]|uniref:plasmid mobilization protein n=1 Tax=Ruminococcus sp. TaxID=41978 RepID=UPI001B65651E|nr:hypothetical protein [Ruminococcus sp.]MBP5432345.1 hypothetical protein [Ruminococcus sp.]